MKVSFVNKVKFHIKKLSKDALMHLPESVIYT